jgi:hypothetical protein
VGPVVGQELIYRLIQLAQLEIPSSTEATPKNSPDDTEAGNKDAPRKTTWRKLKHVGGIVDLRRLRELDEALWKKESRVPPKPRPRSYELPSFA